MLDLFSYSDYKSYFNDWVSQQPRGGHGEYRRLSQALNISSTMVSQVFKGDKNLSLELAAEMADFLQLNDNEAEYFLLLVDHAKAGSFKLQQRFERQIQQKRQEMKRLENRVRKEIELSADAKSIYYSHWIYSATRLLCDIEGLREASAIADKLGVPKNHIFKVLDFLERQGLIKRAKSGKLQLGPTRVYLEASSPLVSRHHQNWRLLGFQKMIQNDEDSFFYTAPMVLSKAVCDEIRQKLPSFVEEVISKVKPSNSEESRCLNIDYFSF